MWVIWIQLGFSGEFCDVGLSCIIYTRKSGLPVRDRIFENFWTSKYRPKFLIWFLGITHQRVSLEILWAIRKNWSCPEILDGYRESLLNPKLIAPDHLSFLLLVSFLVSSYLIFFSSLPFSSLLFSAKLPFSTGRRNVHAVVGLSILVSSALLFSSLLSSPLLSSPLPFSSLFCYITTRTGRRNVHAVVGVSPLYSSLLFPSLLSSFLLNYNSYWSQECSCCGGGGWASTAAAPLESAAENGNSPPGPRSAPSTPRAEAACSARSTAISSTTD